MPHAAAPKLTGSCTAGGCCGAWAGPSACQAICTEASATPPTTSPCGADPMAAGRSTDEDDAAVEAAAVMGDGAPSCGQGDLPSAESRPSEPLRCWKGTGRSTPLPAGLCNHGASAKLTSDAPPRDPEWRSRTIDSVGLGVACNDAVAAAAAAGASGTHDGGTAAKGSASDSAGPTRFRSPSAPHISLHGWGEGPGRGRFAGSARVWGKMAAKSFTTAVCGPPAGSDASRRLGRPTSVTTHVLAAACS